MASGNYTLSSGAWEFSKGQEVTLILVGGNELRGKVLDFQVRWVDLHLTNGRQARVAVKSIAACLAGIQGRLSPTQVTSAW